MEWYHTRGFCRSTWSQSHHSLRSECLCLLLPAVNLCTLRKRLVDQTASWLGFSKGQHSGSACTMQTLAPRDVGVVSGCLETQWFMEESPFLTERVVATLFAFRSGDRVCVARVHGMAAPCQPVSCTSLTFMFKRFLSSAYLHVLASRSDEHDRELCAKSTFRVSRKDPKTWPNE